MAQYGGIPDFTRIIGAYEAGADRAERSRLQRMAEEGRMLSGQVLAGDQSKLQQLFAANPEMGMQVEQFTQQKKKWSREEQAARLDELAAGAMAADTPEKWSAFVQRAAAQGHRLDPGETRESILDQAMGWKEKLAQSNEDRSYNLQKSNADRSYNLNVRQLALEQQKLAGQGPDLVELYDEGTGQPYKARWNPQSSKYERVGGIKAPSGTSLEVGPDGTVSFTQGMGKMTEGQSKDIGYLNRMTSALPTIDKYEGALTSFGETVGGGVPVVGNYAKSAEYQQAEQAGNNFLTALLRKESGATVPPAEQKSYGDIFLPRPGDKPPVIAQKREARRQAAIGIRMGLPAPLIKSMVQQGVDFSTLDPQQGAPGGNGDVSAPRIRTYNPATGELE